MGTNLELVDFAKKALAENWGYCLGTFGNILTPNLMNQKMRQGYGVGAYNTKHQAYLKRFINKRVTDCYGLVKAFTWWNNGAVKYNPAQDRNQEGAYRAANFKGPISSMPEIPGLVLWMRGHAGIYIGNGEFIECAGAPVGMRKGRIANGRVVAGSRFTHWFQDTYITYVIDNSLKAGHSGSKVIALQTDLNKLGYNLVVDGIFGAATKNAVSDFQTKNKLAGAGVATEETQRALIEMVRRISEKQVKLNIRGKAVVARGEMINGTNYIYINDRPAAIRDVAAALRLDVSWDAATRTVMLK